MSRDFKPFEHYFSEQSLVKRGYGDLFDFLEGLKFVSGDKEVTLHSPEEMAIRKQYPQLGRLLMDDFMELYERLSKITGGLEVLHQKDEELKRFIDSKGHDGDKDSYVVKWFKGELDKNFYHSELNNTLFVNETVNEALALNLVKDIAKQLENKENTTSYGEPQAWVSLDNGRSIEVVLEQEGLSEAECFYSARLHCNESEQENGDYEDSIGEIARFVSEPGASIDAVVGLIRDALRCNDEEPIEVHSKASLEDKIQAANAKKSGAAGKEANEREAER